MDMFNVDGELIESNMMYCTYNQANVIKDNCDSCMVKCQGKNQEDYRSDADYFI